MRSNKLLIALTLCLFLSFFASAHSGKTDSDGGHTDHSSGEYHYHHGYSEHQHKDLDGDGVLDCPYSFKDKSESSKNETESTQKSNSKKIKEFLVPIIGCFVLYGVVLLIDEFKWRFKK